MADQTKSEIIITHLVNPSQFWFKYARPNFELLDYETKLCKYVFDALKKPTKKQPAIGDVVMILYRPIEKWARARITDVNKDGTIVTAWVIDHGTPLTSHIKFVVPLLDDNLANAQITSVFKASLYNVLSLSASSTDSPDYMIWSNEAVQAFENFLNTDGTILFETKSVKNNHYFGEIFVDGKKETASQFLVQSGVGKAGNLNNGIYPMRSIEDNLDRRSIKQHQKSNKISPNHQTNDLNSEKFNSFDQRRKKILPFNIDESDDEDIDNRKNYQGESNRQEANNLQSIKLVAAKVIALTNEMHYKEKLKKNPEKPISVPLNQSISSYPNAQSLNKDIKSFFQKLTSDKLIENNLVVETSSTADSDSALTDSSDYKQQEDTIDGIEDEKAYDDDNYDYDDDDDDNDTASVLNIRAKSFKHLLSVPQHITEMENKMPSEIPEDGPILVHGEIQIAQPIKMLKQSNFRDLIINHLSEKVSTMQSYAWPHIMRSNSVILVDHQKNDLTFLPAICSIIYDDRVDRTNYCGPKVFFLCFDAESAISVQDTCNEYLQYQKSVDLNYAVCITDEKNINIRYYNRCEVFIVKLSVWPAVIKKFPSLLVDNVFDTLVVTDVHLMKRNDLKNALNTIMNQLNHHPIQTVLTSKKWVSPLQTISKGAKNPLLLINSHIESAICCGSFFEIKETVNPLDELRKKLSSLEYTQRRTVIICNDDNDVIKVLNYLRDISTNCIPCHSKSSDPQIRSAKAWNQDKGNCQYVLLVCCDAMLFTLNINSAENIIHFSLPKNFEKFSYRHSISLKYYKQYLENNREMKPVTTSTIFIDTNNSELAFQYIYFFVSHEEVQVPEKYYCNRLKYLKDKTENQKVAEGKPLCKDFINYINRDHFATCTDRHQFCATEKLEKEDYRTLTEKEKDFNSSKSYDVKIEILKIISPVLYIVRMLEFRQFNSKWKTCNYSRKFQRYKRSLVDCYRKYNLRQELEYSRINIGFSGVYVNDGKFERCRVIKKISDETRMLRIRLTDTGEELDLSLKKILPLDSEFENFPAQAVTMHFTGLIPWPANFGWSEQAIEITKNFFAKEANNSCNDVFVKATVLFQIKDVIFVDNLHIEHWINPDDKRPYQLENLARQLTNHANLDDSITKYLLGLALNADLISLFQFRYVDSHLAIVRSRASNGYNSSNSREYSRN